MGRSLGPIGAKDGDICVRGVGIPDVGVGAGQLVHAMANSEKKFSSIQGLDITKHTNFITDADSVEMHYASIAEIPLADNSVDIVTCLEVIEHLDNKLMLQGVQELRRVARQRMIVTVPYCEKEPLPHFHKQRYDLARIKRIFPKAKVTFFSLNNSMAWIMIDERL